MGRVAFLGGLFCAHTKGGYDPWGRLTLSKYKTRMLVYLYIMRSMPATDLRTPQVHMSGSLTPSGQTGIKGCLMSFDQSKEN